ncbi:hypothetical protein [Mucilaginibacter sp.]|uniref:hypothetical protein n=1 Tax=Mucilaginibacter sp. TaxID=1882438 RepID=UPI00262F5F7D|nr:hypothetical protein [Mucilaginibacter sp.]MDB4919490.1 hypothetical protein [Mucilaginibacter sp.]
MKYIERILIENVKGIQRLEINDHLIPNKPVIFVAPNGFGKSSFAYAFNKLTKKGIILDDETYYKNNEDNKPKIELRFVNDDRSVCVIIADETQNQIKDHFGVHVINSLLISKHTQKTVPGIPRAVVKSSITINPIILIEKIPNKENFSYSPKNMKEEFGSNGKILFNISEILNDTHLMVELQNNVQFDKFGGVRIDKFLNNVKDRINAFKGTSQEILQKVNDEFEETIINSEPLIDISKILKKHCEFDNAEVLLAIFQLIEIYRNDSKKFKTTLKYYEFINEKQIYDDMFSFFNATWKTLRPKVVDAQLVVEFPKANQISNGERDVISFISSLIRCSRNLNGAKNILIIDEVFDYLDDANLIATQYYISVLIQKFKDEGRIIIPIILTHLNPYYFKNFRFQKLQVCYLDKHRFKNNVSLHKIVLNREEISIKRPLSKYFLHYDPGNCDLTIEFTALNLDLAYCKSINFKRLVENELNLYIANQNYDPISICCAVRIKIEEKVYNLLPTAELKVAYIDTFETDAKLAFAEENGAIFSEVYNLLGLIYNDGLHFSNGVDKITPICSKLNNKTIKNMIQQLS